MMTRLAVLLSLLIPWCAWAGRLPGSSEAEVRLIVLLHGAPLAEPDRGGVRPAGAFLPWPARKLQLAAEQDAVAKQVVALGGAVTERFDTLLNALVVQIPGDRIAAVGALAGVRSVHPERHFSRALETSVPWVGAPRAWSLTTAGGTGAGVKIAIIDSGIDYLHASLGGDGDPDEFAANDPERIEIGTFPTQRVVGGWDFVGDNYDSRGVSGSTTARPDPDPLDTFANGHGTHVAAIAAGNGVLSNGVPYPGPYTVSMDFSRFSVGPGVAPDASLYAFKVFGAAGSSATSIIVRALERSLDPNQDGSFTDRVDVVNLSLGSPFGVMDGRDPEAEAANRLVRQGVIVVAAAGNSGNTFYSLSSPGVANRAITVANSLDDGATFSTIKVLEPASVAGDYACAEGVFTAPLSEHGPVTAPVVLTDPALACEPLQNGPALAGKIALIDRGTCFFADKVRAVQNAGAVGVIVVNNVDGPPIEMGGVGDTTDIRIPGVMISQLDGIVLKGQLGNGLTVTLDAFAAVGRPELADQISDSSARGPGVGDGRLKPDLAAPGTGIVSAKAGTGFEGTSQTGTSMSAPHVSGAAALLRKARPSWSVEDIKAALMNTCTPMYSGSKLPYAESRVGAGRIQVDAALQTLAVVKADTDQGDVSLSFGAYELAEPLSLTRNLRVVNLGAIPVTFQVSASRTWTNPGVVITPLAETVTVPANSSVLLGIRLEVDPARLGILRDTTSGAVIGDKVRYFANEASGQIWLTNTTQRLHVPWHVMARPVSRYRLPVTRLGIPAGERVEVPLPTRGTTAHPSPLVSVWQLGFLSASPGPGTGSLVAAGAASDFGVTRDLARTRLYFGLATAGKWITPQYELIALEVEIDLDRNGTAEFLLVNASGGNLNGQGVDPDLANDALLTLTADMSRLEDYFITNAPLNVLTPEFRDTAAFHNRVLVHSVDAASLGLTPANRLIRYRVTTTDSVSGSQTESPWIELDVMAPVIDPTAHGLRQSPLFDEGSEVRLTVDRAAAAAAGFGGATQPRALLFHQHGESGAQVDVVTLDLATTDTDGDGLGDAWELEHFGDLSPVADMDPDGDGRSNSMEFSQGTNPLDLRMLTPDSETGALRWRGYAGQSYRVERSEWLDGEYRPVFRRIPGVSGVNTVVDPELRSGERTWFYRVRPE